MPLQISLKHSFPDGFVINVQQLLLILQQAAQVRRLLQQTLNGFAISIDSIFCAPGSYCKRRSTPASLSRRKYSPHRSL